MERTQAARLSQEAAGFYADRDDYGNRAAQDIQRALVRQLRDYVPDQATGAVIEHDDGLPLVVVADDQSLYILDVSEADGQSPAVTRCRLLPLDRENTRIEAEVRYRGSERELNLRPLSGWRVQRGDLSLNIAAGTTQEERDTREALARRIATALGWRFPAPDAAGSTEP